MTDRDALDERLRAVERALTDDDRAPVDLSDAAALDDRVDDLARRTTEVEERVAELDAAVQALRGYVGNVRAVNDDVERRADAALAKVESLAREADEGRGGSRSGEEPPGGHSDPADPLSGAGGDSGVAGGASGEPGGRSGAVGGGSSAGGGSPTGGAAGGRSGGADQRADDGADRLGSRADGGASGGSGHGRARGDEDEPGLLERIAEVL